MKSLDKLVSIHAGQALCSQRSIKETNGVSDSKWRLLLDVLRAKNGFYAFESALHFLPLGELSDGFDLVEWNRVDLWKNAYTGFDLSGLTCFAENVFGDQFCLHRDQFVRFDPETGDVELIAKTLDDWAESIISDPDYHLGFALAHRWQEVNGALTKGNRLVPKKPFVCGGDFEVSNLVQMDAVKAMRFRGELATQVRDVPDGSTVKFELRGAGFDG